MLARLASVPVVKLRFAAASRVDRARAPVLDEEINPRKVESVVPAVAPALESRATAPPSATATNDVPFEPFLLPYEPGAANSSRPPLTVVEPLYVPAVPSSKTAPVPFLMIGWLLDV